MLTKRSRSLSKEKVPLGDLSLGESDKGKIKNAPGITAADEPVCVLHTEGQSEERGESSNFLSHGNTPNLLQTSIHVKPLIHSASKKVLSASVVELESNADSSLPVADYQVNNNKSILSATCKEDLEDQEKLDYLCHFLDTLLVQHDKSWSKVKYNYWNYRAS
jgi:hypothetical protein